LAIHRTAFCPSPTGWPRPTLDRCIRYRPLIGISNAEAAEILGMQQELSVTRLVARGVLYKPGKWQKRALDRDEVERVALQRYRPGTCTG
jgi:hypothetical protein